MSPVLHTRSWPFNITPSYFYFLHPYPLINQLMSCSESRFLNSTEFYLKRLIVTTQSIVRYDYEIYVHIMFFLKGYCSFCCHRYYWSFVWNWSNFKKWFKNTKCSSFAWMLSCTDARTFMYISLWGRASLICLERLHWIRSIWFDSRGATLTDLIFFHVARYGRGG